MDSVNVELSRLSRAEHSLYSAGIRRGHCECLNQIAGQLVEAAKTTKSSMMAIIETEEGTPQAVLESIISGYGAFAKQLVEHAESVNKEQQKLLDLFFKQRQEARSFTDKFRNAVQGALGGWRGK